MSRVDKLSILGVRSFDNQSSQVIQFFTPLTLIVGTNGSGKTTIIECLKFATTGDYPPNSTGGAFIHDPKLCPGENQILAQVRLQFYSTEQRRMQVTRNLQLLVQKSKTTFKSLEGNLVVYDKHGERFSLSKRVADLNSQLPQYLGVSKAVLDGVVFCHQDESLWPMSTPLTLKKRFDEIFEAQRYTKAIENIKGLRKAQMEALKEYRNNEQRAKSDKERADKIEKEGMELHEEIEELREQYGAQKTRAEEAKNSATEAWSNYAKYEQVVQSLKAARSNRETYTETLEELEKDLKVLPDTDDQLTERLEKHEERMELQRKRVDEQKIQYNGIQNGIDKARQRQSDKRVEFGQLQQQRANHEKNVKNRELEIKNSAREYNIRGFDTELDIMQINEYIDRITRLRNEQNNKVDRLRKENRAEAEKAQEILNKLRDRRTVLHESKRSAKEQINSNESNINSSILELGKMSTDETAKMSLEAKIEDLEIQLEKAKKQTMESDNLSKIKQANIQLQALEDEGGNLKTELVSATRQAGDLARLDHLKKELQTRHRNLESMSTTHGSRLRKLIEHDWDPATLESDYQRALESKKKQLAQAERERQTVNRDLQQIDFKLNAARDDQRQKQDDVEQCSRYISDKSGGDPDDYPENLAISQANYDTRKADIDAFKHMTNYFRDAIKHAKNDSMCRMCQRGFDNTSEVQKFVERLESRTSRNKLDAWQKEIGSLEIDLNDAKDASTSYDTWSRLTRKELPALKKRIDSLQKEKAEIVQKGESHDSVVSEYEESKQDVESLQKMVGSIVQCSNEANNFAEQIKDLSVKNEPASSTRTLDEIQERLEIVGSQEKEKRLEISKLQDETNRLQNRVSSLGQDVSNAKNKLSTIKYELEKSATKTAQIEELKSSNKKQREVIQDLDSQLQKLVPEFEVEDAKFKEAKEAGEAEEKRLSHAANELSNTVQRLQSIDQGIKDYIEDDGPGKLERCEGSIASLGEEVSGLEAELLQVTREVNKLQKDLSDKDREKRVVVDNLKYRKQKRRLEETETEIKKLSAQNAEADQDRYRQQAEKSERAFEKANMEAASKAAAMKVKDDQLHKFEKEWNEYYKDAAKQYRKVQIEVETTKAAIEDLGKYAGALDKAIMKFHSLKMEEINRSIDELWRDTYQGTDIDTVLIRSDNETARGNRSYNYRVCMVKQDAEMDMRGRCSAGQKVLASIIIRLALADSFGVSCGLIALDEPTTNLDRDNIRSLAKSLHNLIQHRQRQSNFQLIVITHDEDFLRYMQCGDFTDYYFRISRDARQKSRIEKQNISEIV